jgi:hypothetical protein
MKARLAAFPAGLLVLALEGLAAAEPMDLALERLVTNPGCHDAVGHFVSTGDPSNPGWCRPDNVAFKRLVNQLGFAFAPTAMHSARTTGYGGFDIGLEADYTKISSDADYWKRGTRGATDATTHSAPTRNDNPDGVLQLYSVKVRKGFGFGLELGGIVGFMPKTSILSGGADARLSILEGFRRGLLGTFPDVAIGAGVRSITGTPELQLTIASLDAQISKPLPLQDTAVLTPWIGYQHLWIFADAGVVDFTPATDAQGMCGYAGSNVPGNPDPRKPYYDGQPVCTAAGANPQFDFNNNAVFKHARLERHRLLLGFNLRYEMLRAGAQLITDLTSVADAQSSDSDKAALQGEDRQWTLAFDLAAVF